MFRLSVFCHCGKPPVKTTSEEKKVILSHSFGGFSPSLVSLLMACDDSTHHGRSVRQTKFITSWLHVKWRGREEAGKVMLLLGTYLQRPNIPPGAISLPFQIPIISSCWEPGSRYTSLWWAFRATAKRLVVRCRKAFQNGAVKKYNKE